MTQPTTKWLEDNGDLPTNVDVVRITETGDTRITETGDTRVLEEGTNALKAPTSWSEDEY